MCIFSATSWIGDSGKQLVLQVRSTESSQVSRWERLRGRGSREWEITDVNALGTAARVIDFGPSRLGSTATPVTVFSQPAPVALPGSWGRKSSADGLRPVGAPTLAAAEVFRGCSSSPTSPSRLSVTQSTNSITHRTATTIKESK
jgi:hypothetical protein